MKANQRVVAAVAVFVVLGALALLSWSYQSQSPAAHAAADAVTLIVSSAEDRGPGSLREALFIAASANGRASVLIKAKTITLRTALPPLLNVHGTRILAQAGEEIDARTLTGGPVFDVSAPNASIEGVVVRNCPAVAVLVRAARFHLQSSTLDSCDVGVDVAENASDALLERNRFVNNRIAVRFAAAIPNSAVTGNHFLQSRDAGVWAVRGEGAAHIAPISIRDNHFNGGRSGVVAGNVAVLIERNDFAAAADAAIHLVGGGVAVRGNHVSGGAAMGIVAENAPGTVIEDNELDHLTAYAIMVHGCANALIRANRVHDSGYGMALLLGDARRPSTVADNTIIEPKFDGIDVIGDSPLLRGNQVLRPHALALHVTDYQPPGGQTVRAQPQLEGNNFRANALQVAADETAVQKAPSRQ
jgi:parallel beta helix pectate lyase-like protein